MKVGVQALRAIIRGFYAEGATVRRQISKATGPRRYELWNRKRVLGSYARDHMIAYGLLRGVPYAIIERPSRVNPPSHSAVYAIMRTYGGVQSSRLTIEEVQAMLATQVPGK